MVRKWWLKRLKRMYEGMRKNDHQFQRRANCRKPLRIEWLESRTLLSYTITDLGVNGYAYGINNSGQVVGEASNRAYLYRDGQLINLGSLPGYDYSTAYGINESGAVVGKASASSGPSRAFLYNGGPLVDLGRLGGSGSGSAAYAINDSGQIVGESDNPIPHAFRTAPYAPINVGDDLGSLGGGLSKAFAINASGYVVGQSWTSSNHTDAFLSDGHSMTDLGSLGGPGSDAHGINNAGRIVGLALTPASSGHAFRTGSYARINPATDDLGDLSGGLARALALNSTDQVVGYFGSPTPRAFIYTNGSLTDLNYLLPPNSGWTLYEATAINDIGQIVGFGVHNGQFSRAFLMTPEVQQLDIVLDSVQTSDSRGVTVEYDINTAVGSQPFNIGIFQSPTESFDSRNNHPLGSLAVSGTDVTIGHHTKPINLAIGIPIDTDFRYVVAAADPDGELKGVNIDNRAHFRTYVIGAVVVGFDPFAWRQERSPADWVQTMADTLGTLGYDRHIPFSWASGKPTPGAITAASHNLALQIVAAFDSLGSLAPNDVVDIHLIGHSRGSVVISLAMDELLTEPRLQLQQGYMEMTLLDPHPANLEYGLNADFNPFDPFSGDIVAAYEAFELAVHDPPVRIPARVNEVEHLWQQNPWYVPPFSSESLLNLWGLNPQQIQYENPESTRRFERDLTGVDGIGHSEVHEYYQSLLNGGQPRPGGGNDHGHISVSIPALLARGFTEPLFLTAIPRTEVEFFHGPIPELKQDELKRYLAELQDRLSNDTALLSVDASRDCTLPTRHKAKDVDMEIRSGVCSSVILGLDTFG